MATITQRISHFRGINRSAQQNGLDVSYAYNAENVDISGGKVSSKVGSYRLVSSVDVPPAKPIPYFTNAVDYMILRKKYIQLYDRGYPDPEQGGYEPFHNSIEDVIWDWDDEDEESQDWHTTTLLIRGAGRAALRARINNIDCVICTGMLGQILDDGEQPIPRYRVDSENIDDYYYYRGFIVDGADAKTCVYYLSSGLQPKIHCRKFGSGTYILKDKAIAAIGSNSDGQITSLTMYTMYADLSDKEKDRTLLDGIYLFHDPIGNSVDEDDLDNAFMWLKVTSITASGGGNAVLNVETTRLASEVTTGDGGDYILVRGECSDIVVSFMTMYYGRLFAAAHRSNRTHPRRLYWSCLPGDGRTIEDWTQSEYSIDTSGGHVDIGDPSDGYIAGLVVCNNQLLIFTQTRLWRMYGTAPSNWRLELVGNLEGTRISNPVEINGTVYWLSWSGITYYNGSYVAVMDDNCSTRRLLETFPEYMKDSMYYSSVHASLFDNNIMFAIDATFSRERFDDDDEEYDECYIIRYNLETGDVIKYCVPAERYRQQFTSVLSKNFGVVNGAKVNYETRYFQSLVHKPEWVYDEDTQQRVLVHPHSMTMTQWKAFGMQEHGWYDDQPVYSVWESDWNDLRTPETVKRVHTAIMRGSGEFDFTVESETNKDEIHVIMPETRAKVKELTPHNAEGRSMRFAISSDREFEIEPYMTLIFEAGNKR